MRVRHTKADRSQIMPTQITPTQTPSMLATPTQATLARPVSFDGIGVHTAVPARLTLHPADPGTGIVFHRTNLVRGADRFIPAWLTRAVMSDLATRLAPADAPGEGVGTVEHVLATLSALGIDNALVEVDGPEVPILDGSAQPLVEGIDAAGLVLQPALRRTLEVLKPVRVAHGRAFAELAPFADGLALDVAIDFDAPAIGRQRKSVVLDGTVFRREIARARTFGLIGDAERLWRAGLARGSSFENTLVFATDRVLNPTPMRFADECVRHKMLDAIGDLALAGLPIRGAFRSLRCGHALNRAVLAALLADRSAWRIVGAPMPSRRTDRARRADRHA